jgi:hypothetical protein
MLTNVDVTLKSVTNVLDLYVLFAREVHANLPAACKLDLAVAVYEAIQDDRWSPINHYFFSSGTPGVVINKLSACT